MTTSTSKEQAQPVADALRQHFVNEPGIGKIELASDDAGLHVVVNVRRLALPAGAKPPRLRVVDGVRVCVVVHG